MAERVLTHSANWTITRTITTPTYNTSSTGGYEVGLPGVADWSATIEFQWLGDMATDGAYDATIDVGDTPDRINFYENGSTGIAFYSLLPIIADLEVPPVAFGEVVMARLTVEGNGELLDNTKVGGTTVLSAKNGKVTFGS
jgi:hypothetical protein